MLPRVCLETLGNACNKVIINMRAGHHSVFHHTQTCVPGLHGVVACQREAPSAQGATRMLIVSYHVHSFIWARSPPQVLM